MPSGFSQVLRKVVGQLALDDVSDGELLARFHERRDESAFSVLVHRHGRMVWGVCRRMLGNHADADDAFQASFVVLVRRASAFVHRPNLGNVLYGIATHTAMKARTMAQRRRVRESKVEAHGPGPDQAALLSALDEELAKLPAKYREPVVMCELEGVARKQVAAQLGIAEGTISSRLATAHRMLKQQLQARGFAVTGVAAMLAEPASALESSLTESALHAVGQAPSARVALLASEVTKMMLLSQWKLSGAIVAGLLMVALAGSMWSPTLAGVAGQEPVTPQPTPTELVNQLDSESFDIRDRAEKALRALGAKAYLAVKDGTKAGRPLEVVRRCQLMLPELQVASLIEEHPTLWKRYVDITGETKLAREIFSEMLADTQRAHRLDATAKNPGSAAETYRDELHRNIVALREGYDEAERRAQGRTGLLLPASGTPNRGEFAALLLLGSFPASAQVKPSVDVHWREGLHHNLFSFGLQGQRFEDRTIQQSPEIHRLFVAWLRVRRDPAMLRHGLMLATRSAVREVLPLARELVQDASLSNVDRAAAFFPLGRFGDVGDARLLEPWFTCKDEFANNNYRDKDGREYPIITQVRDAAYGIAGLLSGHEPFNLGFERSIEYRFFGAKVLENHSFALGFASDEQRLIAHARVAAALKPPDEYLLRPGENLRLVPPPFPDARRHLLDTTFPTVENRDKYWIVWTSDGKALKSSYMRGPNSVEHPLSDVLEEVFQLNRIDIVANEGVLKAPVRGDVVVRPGVASEELLKSLRNELKSKFDLDLAMCFREMDRECIVLRGDLRLPPPQPNGSSSIVQVDLFRARKLERATRGTAGFGARILPLGFSTYFERPVVDESDLRTHNGTQFRVSWDDQNPARDDPELEKFFDNIKVQTGLSLKLETRKVRSLFVEKAREPAKIDR